MPIYEFKCQDCGHIFEVFFKSREDFTHQACPQCQSQRTAKIFSTPARVSVSSTRPSGLTCCGRSERCETPPCTTGGSCRRN